MEFTSRFTLYDLLAMVFPGCFFIWSMMSFDNICQFVHKPAYMSELDCYIAFFVVAYIIGLGWNIIIGWIWRQFIKSIEESCIKKVLEGTGGKCYDYFNALTGDNNSERYKCAYAYIRKNEPRYTLNVVESQISMLRNMAIPLACCIGTLIYNCSSANTCISVMIGAGIFLIIFCLAIFRQHRLYELVFKSYMRMKILEGAQTTTAN